MSRYKYAFQVCVALAVTLAFCFPFRATAQSLSIFGIDDSAFPTLTAKFFAFDAAGNQVARTAGELTLTENGFPRSITSVTCPPLAQPRAISSVLTMDVSGSMAFGFGGVANIDLAKAAARAWIAGLPLGQSECAITSFDQANYFNRDFTTNAATLNAAINALAPVGGTDYNMGLLNPHAGALEASKRGQYQKVIVFLTDGMPQTLTNEAAIIAEAQSQSCIVYVVTVGMPCPQTLRNIASQTGGGWFQNVTTVAEAEAIYRRILAEVQSGSPCSITWQSSLCPGGERIVELADASAKGMDAYTLADANAARLTFAPTAVFLRSKPLGVPFDTVITVTAVNSAFNITDVTSTNTAFSIAPKVFSLAAGQSTTVTVTFTPVDSGYAWTEFNFVNSLCLQNYYASGGYPGKRSTLPTLVLNDPNGGEELVVGSTFDVLWSGIPETDNVKLDYSTDNGSTWRSISALATGGAFEWTVPNTPTTTALARVTRLPVGATDDTGLLFTLTGHTDDVVKARWSPDGMRVATAGFDGNMKIYDATTGLVMHTCPTPSQGLLSLDWSPNGSQVAVSGNMGHASAWNALTGALSRTFSGHAPFSQVWTITWRPDGSQVATASVDGTCNTWSATTGASIHSLAGHSISPLNVAWNPTGTQLVTVAMDARGIIWDAATGAEIAPRLTGHTGPIGYVSWSPTGNRIATASDDNTVKIWDATSHALVATLIGHTAYIQSVQFSPDGTRVLTSSDDRTARVWNPTTGAQMFALNSTAAVRDAAWSNDGTMIVTGSEDNRGVVWDAGSGARLQDLVGHTAAVTSVEFSPNGLYVVTGSDDNTAKIWGIYETPLMRDTSDTFFSIVRPTPAAADVDMGRVVVGGAKDSVITAFVTNTGTYPFGVDSIVVRGTDAAQFSTVSGFGPFTLAPAETRALEVRFKPASVGPKTASLRVFTTSGSQIQILVGVGVAPVLEIVGGLIDFGQVPIGTTKSMTQVATVRNIGPSDITITNVRQVGPNTADFASPIIGQTLTLAPGSSAQLIDVDFSATEMGRTSGNLLFDYNAEGSPASVVLFAEGIASLPLEKGTATLQVGSANARTGDIVNITIKLVADSNLVNTGATTVTGQLRYNNTLLEPLSPLAMGTLDGNDRVIDLTLPLLSDGNGNLALMQFRAALGNDSTTPLVLENVQAQGGLLTVTSLDGKFTLDGICLAGGARLLNPNGQVDLSAGTLVQGGTTDVEIETSESGTIMLTLNDIRGRLIKTFINGEMDSGRRELPLDFSDVTSGSYILTLRTPTVQRSVRIEVAR